MSKAKLIITAVVLEGRSQAEVARAYGVSPGWVSRLLARYKAEGDTAFQPRSKRPKSSPNTISDHRRARIIDLRKTLTAEGHDAGAHTIAWHLDKENMALLTYPWVIFGLGGLVGGRRGSALRGR